MIQINIRHDLNRLSADLRLMAKEQMAAAVRAINRSMTTVKAQGARDLAKTIGLPVRLAKGQIRFKRATQAEARALLTFSGVRIPLRRFGASQTATGAQARLAGKTVSVPHGFIARMPGGHTGVFLRAPTAKGQLYNALRYRAQRLRQRGRDLPIAEIFAPSLGETLVRTALDVALARLARERFAVVFGQEAKFRLAKKGPQ